MPAQVIRLAQVGHVHRVLYANQGEEHWMIKLMLKDLVTVFPRGNAGLKMRQLAPDLQAHVRQRVRDGTVTMVCPKVVETLTPAKELGQAMIKLEQAVLKLGLGLSEISVLEAAVIALIQTWDGLSEEERTLHLQRWQEHIQRVRNVNEPG